jgi:aromatic-L-amino-acid/L-tryptophan decarboxylase
MKNSKLNLSTEEIEHAGRLLTTLLQDYEHAAPKNKVMPSVDRSALAELLNTPFPEQGVGIDELFRDINDKIIPNSTTISSPRYLAVVQLS